MITLMTFSELSLDINIKLLEEMQLRILVGMFYIWDVIYLYILKISKYPLKRHIQLRYEHRTIYCKIVLLKNRKMSTYLNTGKQLKFIKSVAE